METNKTITNFTKQLNIIEEDCKLTDQEKKQVYIKMQNKLEKILKRTEKKRQTFETLTGLSAFVAGDAARNSALGVLSIFLAILAALGIYGGIINNSAVITAISSGVAATSLAGITNAVVNSSTFGDSIIETAATKAMYKHKDIVSTLKSIHKQLDSKIKQLDSQSTM